MSNDKQTGIELKKTITLLEKAKEETVEHMGECISLAADAGDIISSARKEDADLDTILAIAGINGEQARRLERVAKARPTLSAPAPGQLKQLALWAGILPDPIENSTPRPERAWHHYVVLCKQWIAKKVVDQWSPEQRTEFVDEARPIAQAFHDAGGKL